MAVETDNINPYDIGNNERDFKIIPYGDQFSENPSVGKGSKKLKSKKYLSALEEYYNKFDEYYSEFTELSFSTKHTPVYQNSLYQTKPKHFLVDDNGILNWDLWNNYIHTISEDEKKTTPPYTFGGNYFVGFFYVPKGIKTKFSAISGWPNCTKIFWNIHIPIIPFSEFEGVITNLDLNNISQTYEYYTIYQQFSTMNFTFNEYPHYVVFMGQLSNTLIPADASSVTNPSRDNVFVGTVNYLFQSKEEIRQEIDFLKTIPLYSDFELPVFSIPQIKYPLTYTDFIHSINTSTDGRVTIESNECIFPTIPFQFLFDYISKLDVSFRYNTYIA